MASTIIETTLCADLDGGYFLVDAPVEVEIAHDGEVLGVTVTWTPAEVAESVADHDDAVEAPFASGECILGLLSDQDVRGMLWSIKEEADAR